MGVRKKSRPRKLNAGLPSHRFFQGMAPGRIVPPPLGKAATHHDIIAFAELLDKARRFAEIIAIVRISHKNPSSAGRLDPAAEGTAIAFCDDFDDACSVVASEGKRAIGGTIVGDKDLTFDASGDETALGFVDTCNEGLSLVQARHQDREIQLLPWVHAYFHSTPTACFF
jgi:hypothetical protein